MKRVLGSGSLLLLLLLLLLSLSMASACSKRNAGVPGGKKAAIRIGDEVITVDEIDRRVAPELFELRSSALRAVLVEHLLHREAKRRGVDLEVLRQQEVESKVPMPSDAEGAKALSEWLAAGRLKPEEAARMSPAAAAERLRSLLMSKAEEAFYDRLVRDNAVRVDFGALGKPELKMALDGPTLGPPDAPIKIVEFADLSQSFTSMWQPTLEHLVAKYGTRVQFRFKQKPAAPQSDGAKLAEGALCADEQGRYWEFRKALFKNKNTGGVEALGPVATAANLNLPAFQNCLAGGNKKALVAANAREAALNRLEGEPVVSINGILVSGAQDLATIERLLRFEIDVL